MLMTRLEKGGSHPGLEITGKLAAFFSDRRGG
jgi:hypothetical protein